MRRETLATLRKLRARETVEAQAELARTAEVRRQAAERALSVAQAVRAEAPGQVPVTYGTWLTAQLALRQQARAAEAVAVAGEERARTALIGARQAERVVELLQEARQAEQKRRAARRETAALDEAAARRRAG